MKEYSSKITSLHKVDEDSDQANKNLRYEDLLNLVEEDIRSPIDIEFSEVSGKFWSNAKLKERRKEELKSVLILSNCTYMKTLNLNSEIYNKFNEMDTSKDRGAQKT